MATPLRVLIVEDSDDDAELLRLELERGGYTLEWTRVETEEAFKNALDTERWDLIVSDYQMPAFDGLRAFDIYRDSRVDVPFIFVSGALGEERAVEAMRAGARDYILKGSLKRLNAAVRRELAEVENRRRQRAAEDAVKQEQRRLALAIEATGVGIVEYYSPPRPETFVSAQWAKILGFELSELPPYDKLREWFFDRMEPNDRKVTRSAYEKFLRSTEERFSFEARVEHKSGRRLDVVILLYVLDRHEDGTPSHIMSVTLDMSDRRQLESQLRQSQKMEAIGRLSGGVAHDFNNLLTAIISFSKFAQDTLDEGSTAHKDIQEVLNAADRARSLTSQLLAFSRKSIISPKVLNVNEIVAGTDRMLRRLLGEDIQFRSSLAPDAGNVYIDPSGLDQVLINLAVNARDAMPDGGKLTIETRNIYLDETYTLMHGREVEPGNYVVITVSDNGSGIDEELQSRIFEPFFTTKDPGKGTGLGLATCYGIIKQARGHISVYSELNVGTTFKVYLPVAARPKDEDFGKEPLHAASGSNETILLVEDNDTVRQLALRTLEGAGYKVLVARDGDDAVNLFKTSGLKISLLLTDVVMPGKSGTQVAAELLAEDPSIRVLYMSGYTGESTMHNGTLETGQMFLEKPFNPASLTSKVREALDGR